MRCLVGSTADVMFLSWNRHKKHLRKKAWRTRIAVVSVGDRSRNRALLLLREPEVGGCHSVRRHLPPLIVRIAGPDVLITVSALAIRGDLPCSNIRSDARSRSDMMERAWGHRFTSHKNRSLPPFGRTDAEVQWTPVVRLLMKIG
jgi:hypothetical protein